MRLVPVEASAGSGPPSIVIDVVAAVIERDGRLLVTRRTAGSHLEGLWEFPGGKVQPGESREDALAREIREELAVSVTVGPLVLDTLHRYDDRTVWLFFYACGLIGSPSAVLGQEMRWVERRSLGTLDFPAADAELIRILAAQDG
jgi:8-oxo-dGTP diphosphatase